MSRLKSGSAKLVFDTNGVKCFVVPCLLFWLVGGLTLLTSSGFEAFKWVHTAHNSFLDFVFKGVTQVGEFIVIGSILLALLLFKYRSWAFFLLTIFTQLIPFLINQGLKFIFTEPRPYSVYGNEPWFHHIEGVVMHNNLSFPSGHTAGAFAFFTLLSLLLPKKYSAVAIVYFILALLVGISRMYLGQHFFVDIYVGSILGTLSVLLFNHFWKKKFQPKTLAE